MLEIVVIIVVFCLTYLLIKKIPTQPSVPLFVEKPKITMTSVNDETTNIIDTTKPPLDNIIDMDKNGSTILMKVGEKTKLILPGNATTGYAWRIVKIEGTSIKPDAKWQYKMQFPFLMGSGGYFQREFYAQEAGITDIYFIYDAVAEPQLGYYYYLQFDVRS